MTSFTRIVIVLSILRTALGTQQVPSSQIILGLSLFLSLFIMMPVFDKVYDSALEPYLDEQMPAQEALQQAQEAPAALIVPPDSHSGFQEDR